MFFFSRPGKNIFLNPMTFPGFPWARATPEGHTRGVYAASLSSSSLWATTTRSIFLKFHRQKTSAGGSRHQLKVNKGRRPLSDSRTEAFILLLKASTRLFVWAPIRLKLNVDVLENFDRLHHFSLALKAKKVEVLHTKMSTHTHTHTP